jgi:hypothetical protein
MTNLSNQPFLLSMAQAAQQTGNFSDYQTLLNEQQTQFKDFLYETCKPDIPAPVRFEFLSHAEYEICSIRLKYADEIRKIDKDFYRFWSMLIVDTRRYISIGINILNFLTTCPPYLLTEPSKTFPEYRWMGSRIDLTEGLAALFLSNVIRLKDGKPVAFAPFSKFIGSFFGISFKNPHLEMQKVINRKKNQTPFLDRMIESIKGKNLFSNT